MRTCKGSPGDVVRIDLGDGRHTYGVLLVNPYVAVYDMVTTGETVERAEVLDRPILFVVAVYNVGRAWPVVGKVPEERALPAVPEQFMQDVADPSRCEIIDVNGNVRPATPQECVGLERAAVWEPEDVVERIRDHYAGRPNRHLEYMKVRL